MSAPNQQTEYADIEVYWKLKMIMIMNLARQLQAVNMKLVVRVQYEVSLSSKCHYLWPQCRGNVGALPDIWVLGSCGGFP